MTVQLLLKVWVLEALEDIHDQKVQDANIITPIIYNLRIVCGCFRGLLCIAEKLETIAMIRMVRMDMSSPQLFIIFLCK